MKRNRKGGSGGTDISKASGLRHAQAVGRMWVRSKTNHGGGNARDGGEISQGRDKGGDESAIG